MKLRKLPKNKLARITIGVGLIIGGILGFLPVLGFWMIPLGVLVLSIDLPKVRRFRRNFDVKWGRKRAKFGERKMSGKEFAATAEDVKKAGKRLNGVVTRTSLLSSVELDRLTGGRVFIKPECLQKSGSFKFRGAYNRIAQLTDDEKKAGVVACSSGNHGQGLALASKMEGVSATIVMPEDAPQIKIDKTRSHGAEIVLFNRYTDVREEIAQGICDREGRVIVPPYDDPNIIAGQGTSALEALEDIKALGLEFDAYLVPSGGGGLFAGSNLIINAMSPNTKTYSVEPVGWDDHKKSFETGERVGVDKDAPVSACDALMAPIPGELTFPINFEYADKGLVVTEDEIEEAIRFAFNNLKIVAEPGGVVGLAAILAGKIKTEGKVIGILISGGNIDGDQFSKILNKTT